MTVRHAWVKLRTVLPRVTGHTRYVHARQMIMSKHRIAVIPGDGIASEVVPEGIRVLEAAGRRFGIELQLQGNSSS